MSSEPTTEEHARELLERGYTVIRHSHSEDDVAAIRERILAIYAEHGTPTPYANPTRELSANVLVNPTGFVMFKLLAIAPELSPRLMSPRVVDVARALLGRDMHVELTGASLSDPSRPFFTWHNHIGGIDVEDYRERRAFPRFERSERLIAVLYLDDIDEGGGELLALPRKISEPTEPPFDLFTHHWAGEERITFPKGSTLIFEQCTWHAVLPQLRPGIRIFVGCYFTSSAAAKTVAVDDSLRGFRGGGDLLQSVLPRE